MLKTIFNKKQWIIIWIVGIFVCLFLILDSVKISKTTQRAGLYYLPGVNDSSPPRVNYDIYVKDWSRALLYPAIIIGGLLVITFNKK